MTTTPRTPCRRVSCARTRRSAGSGGGDGRAWLLTIVRNVCFTRLRERQRAVATEPFDDAAHGAENETGEANAVAWREINEARLSEALQRLAPEFREAIVLHELEGLSYREMAEVAAIPIGTVMSRLARARAKLQGELITLAKESSHEL